MTSRKLFKFATQSEKPGLSSSISLETVAPEALQFEKINKNEPNSQTNSVFWLVAVGIHNPRGISPYGDLGVLWASGGGVKNLKKRLFKAKNAIHRTIIINEHFFFCTGIA